MAVVTPRSRGYGDVSVTYIRRSKISSCIYAKHQYRQESECGSTVVIYILTEKYKYMVITESDTILQEYYITRKYKSTSYEEIYITKAERCSRAAREVARANQEKSWEEELLRCPRFCCTPITTEGSAAHSDQLQQCHHGLVSRIWTWGSRVVRCNPTSTYDKAKWRAYQAHVYRKGVSWI